MSRHFYCVVQNSSTCKKNKGKSLFTMTLHFLEVTTIKQDIILHRKHCKKKDRIHTFVFDNRNHGH